MRRCDWSKLIFFRVSTVLMLRLIRPLYITLTAIPQRQDTWLLYVCVCINVRALHCASINRVTNVNTNGQAREGRKWCDVTVCQGIKTQNEMTAAILLNTLGHSFITSSLLLLLHLFLSHPLFLLFLLYYYYITLFWRFSCPPLLLIQLIISYFFMHL